MHDIELVRKDFPALQQKRHTRPPIYFDTACTALKPQSVIDAVTQYNSAFSGCAGRSSHWFADQTQQAVELTRKKIQTFINAAKSEEIVFTANTTHAINLLAYQLMQRGGVVVTTDKEHNSNFLPWLRLAEKKHVRLEIIPTDTTTGMIDFESLDTILTETKNEARMKIVSIHAVSNFDGSHQDVQKIAAIAHTHDFLLHVDAAQAIPHAKIDVQREHIDFMSFSGHKMLGPSGTGVFYGNYDYLSTFETLLIGGGTPLDVTYTDFQLAYPPSRFEAGIQNYAGIIGLGAAVDYLVDFLNDPHAIQDHTLTLNTYLTEELLKISDRITIIGPQHPNHRPSILSFTLQGMHHQQVAQILNEQNNIMARAGRHCVHAYCNKYTIPGTIRLSFYVYNTMEECDVLLETMKEIIKI